MYKKPFLTFAFLTQSACISLPSSPTVVPFETLHGSVAGVGKIPRHIVIRDEDSWQKFRGSLSSTEVFRQPIDFGTSMVVGVYVPGPNSCYRAKITKIRREKEKILVEYREVIPFGNAVCISATIDAGHLVKVPQFAGPVEFAMVGHATK
jgi:hypothetical protein